MGRKRKRKKRPARSRGRKGPCWQTVTGPIEPGWRRTSPENLALAALAGAVAATTRVRTAAVAAAADDDAGVPLWVGGTLACIDVGAVA